MIRIFDIEWWREIFQSLGRNKKRSIFTSLGVIWGTFMLVLLLGAGMGISGIVTKQLPPPYHIRACLPEDGGKCGTWIWRK